MASSGNDGLSSTTPAPLGGVKQREIGSEGGHYVIEDYLEVNYISIGL